MSKLVTFMELDAINSGKGRKYLEIDYTIPEWGAGNSLSLRHRMDNDPRVIEYKAQGYVGPRLIAVFKEDLELELAQVVAECEAGGWIQSHEMELNKKRKELTAAKALYDARKVEV